MANIRRIFADICRGYSTDTWNNKQIFVKHLSHTEQVEIDTFYDIAFENAIKRGILSRADRLKWLEKKNWWTQKDEIELLQQKDYVQGLVGAKDKMIFEVQKKQQEKVVIEEKAKLNKMIEKREALMELTAEQSADQKSQYQYVLLSFFSDKDCQIPIFTQEDINQLSDEESNKLINKYITIIKQFGEDSLKRIAVAGFFINYFYLCGEDIAKFFNKAICNLSFYQINLLSHAVYYKRLMTEHSIPSSIKEDPYKIEDYVIKGKNFKDIMAKTGGGEGGRVGLVGATQADFDTLNIKNSAKEMQKAAEKQYTSAIDAARDLGYTIT